MMGRVIVASVAAVLGACSTVSVVPAVDGKYKTIRTREVLETNGLRLTPQTFRNTVKSAGADVYLGEVGGTAWPHAGMPDKGLGICLDPARPTWMAIYGQATGACFELVGKAPPPITMEPLPGN